MQRLSLGMRSTYALRPQMVAVRRLNINPEQGRQTETPYKWVKHSERSSKSFYFFNPWTVISGKFHTCFYMIFKLNALVIFLTVSKIGPNFNMQILYTWDR